MDNFEEWYNKVKDIISVARNHTEEDLRFLAAVYHESPAGWEEIKQNLPNPITAQAIMDSFQKFGEYRVPSDERLTSTDIDRLVAKDFIMPQVKYLGLIAMSQKELFVTMARLAALFTSPNGWEGLVREQTVKFASSAMVGMLMQPFSPSKWPLDVCRTIKVCPEDLLASSFSPEDQVIVVRSLEGIYLYRSPDYAYKLARLLLEHSIIKDEIVEGYKKTLYDWAQCKLPEDDIALQTMALAKIEKLGAVRVLSVYGDPRHSSRT